ncbi:MAG TPA: thiamine-phosphate kinase [Actinomycetales bacterium]
MLDPATSTPVTSTPVLGDVGEAGLLSVMVPLLPTGGATLLGPGDDAAVVAAPDGRVVATTDVLVEGRDFRRDWSSAEDVGVKAGAQNLADVAAMGAVPTALLVGLVAPADLPVGWALGLARGLAQACAGTSAGVVGGDLSAGVELMVSVTALGDLQGRAPVLRSGAGPGQDVALAGVLGRSAAGLAALLALGPEDADRRLPGLVAAHRRPRPPYEAGPAAARAGAVAMLDLSDGLLRDAGRVAEASGVVLDLDPAVLQKYVEPLREAAETLGADLWAWVLGGGEDHGLLAVFAPGTAPEGFTVIGRTSAVPAGGEPQVLLGGSLPTATPGWDHFGG